MECPKPKQFYQELIGAATAFYNEQPVEMQRIINDLLYTLRNTVDILASYNDDWDNPVRSQTMDSMDCLCANLRDAGALRMLIQRLKCLEGDENRARRLETLGALREMLDFCHESMLQEAVE